MPGHNRFTSAASAAQQSKAGVVYLRKCVFISHKCEDSVIARDIADTLVDMNVDVWLDLDELDATTPVTDEEHLALTHSIERGVNNSTHLLALITPKTRASWWVPFEIGTARARKKELAFFVHKQVADAPSYFQLGSTLDSKHQFLAWAKELSDIPMSAGLKAISGLIAPTKLDLYLRS